MSRISNCSVASRTVQLRPELFSCVPLRILHSK